MLDQYGRTIEYMRISITDRCNLRCRYCMPEGIMTVPPSEILTYEQITETARAGRLDGVAECLAAFEETRARILAALEERP